MQYQAATARLAETLAVSLPGADSRIQACGGIQLLSQLLAQGAQGPATAALAALCAPSLPTSQNTCQLVLASDALHYLGPMLDVSDLRTRTSILALLCPLSWQGPEASRAISAIIGLHRCQSVALLAHRFVLQLAHAPCTCVWQVSHSARLHCSSCMLTDRICMLLMSSQCADASLCNLAEGSATGICHLAYPNMIEAKKLSWPCSGFCTPCQAAPCQCGIAVAATESSYTVLCIDESIG